MSSEEDNEIDLDSVHLVDYLKKDIPVEELRDFSSSRRIGSIDFVKGIAIVFIIGAHTAGAWLVPSWRFFYGVLFSFLDILGPSLFVFLSALSVVFSIRRRKASTHEKVIRNRIFSRGIMIIAIAVIFNLVSIEFTIPGYSFPATLWGWNILMFIGASGDLLTTVLHYIITSPSPMTPLLPWISICFISSIFGEYLYEAMMGGTKKDYRKLFRTFLYWGIFLVIVGVFLGRNSYIPGDVFLAATDTTIGTLPLNEYPHLLLLGDTNVPTYVHNITYPGMWEFLIRGRAPNMIYNLGAALVLIAVCFYIVDIKRKMNNFISMINYYGKVSLSLFLLHFVFITLFLNSLDIIPYWILLFGYVGFWGFAMYIWNEFYGGKGSPEWLMVQIGRIGQKTGKTVKKEMLVIEEGIKETVQKIKKDRKEDSNN